MNSVDLINFNLHFLVLARDVSRDDPLKAKMAFGLSDPDIDNLLNLPLVELNKIAAAGIPLCKLSIPLRPSTCSPTEGLANAMLFWRTAE